MESLATLLPYSHFYTSSSIGNGIHASKNKKNSLIKMLYYTKKSLIKVSCYAKKSLIKV